MGEASDIRSPPPLRQAEAAKAVRGLCREAKAADAAAWRLKGLECVSIPAG